MKTAQMKFWIFLLIGFLLPSFATAQNATEIVKKANLASYYRGDDGSSQMLMKVYSPNRKKPIKKMFYMLKFDVKDGGEQMFFTYFTQPSDIRRTTFLVHKKINGDDFRRLYIPASDKILAIAGSRKQDPFMGSDFSYEDVSGRHYSKDNHKLLGSEPIKMRKKTYQAYVVESIPKEKEDKIAKIKSWIDQKTFIPIRVEYYNHEGKLFKYYRSVKVKTIQGFPTIIKQVMVSPIEKTKTIILVNPRKVRYNIGLSLQDFSERSLKNPPVQYFK